MSSQKNTQKKGIILALITALLWSTLGVGLKLAVSNLDSFVVAVYIGIFATLTLGIYLTLKQKINKVVDEFKKNKLFFILAGIIGLGIQQILYIKGYQLLPASFVVILFYTYPLLMILLSSIIFKEKISLKSLFFVILGFFGVYILVSKGTLTIPALSLGVILVFLAAFSWALFSVLIKYKKYDIEIGMFLFSLFGLILLILLIPFFGFHFKITFYEILGITYLAIFPTALAFLLWNKALQLTKTYICSNIALLVPLLSVILIAIILKEEIVMSQIIGLILIIGSVLLNINTK